MLQDPEVRALDYSVCFRWEVAKDRRRYLTECQGLNELRYARCHQEHRAEASQFGDAVDVSCRDVLIDALFGQVWNACAHETACDQHCQCDREEYRDARQVAR